MSREREEHRASIDHTTAILDVPRYRRTAIGLIGGGLATLVGLTEVKARKRKKKRRHKHKSPPSHEQPRPTEELDAECPADGGASHVANIPALTFVPRRSGLLTRAWVLLSDSQAGQDFKLVLTPVNAAGLPVEEILAIEEVLDLPKTGPGNSPQPLAVTFTDPARVSQGTRYALVVLSEQGFQLRLGDSARCLDSLAYDDTNRDGVFTPFPDRDFAFETCVFGVG